MMNEWVPTMTEVRLEKGLVTFLDGTKIVDVQVVELNSNLENISDTVVVEVDEKTFIDTIRLETPSGCYETKLNWLLGPGDDLRLHPGKGGPSDLFWRECR